MLPSQLVYTKLWTVIKMITIQNQWVWRMWNRSHLIAFLLTQHFHIIPLHWSSSCLDGINSSKYSSNLLHIKGPFWDHNMLFLWHSFIGILEISLLPIFSRFWVCVCELCPFYCITLLYKPLYVGISMLTWKMHKFIDYVAKQVNLQEIFSTQILCT